MRTRSPIPSSQRIKNSVAEDAVAEAEDAQASILKGGGSKDCVESECEEEDSCMMCEGGCCGDKHKVREIPPYDHRICAEIYSLLGQSRSCSRGRELLVGDLLIRVFSTSHETEQSSNFEIFGSSQSSCSRP